MTKPRHPHLAPSAPTESPRVPAEPWLSIQQRFPCTSQLLTPRLITAIIPINSFCTDPPFTAPQSPYSPRAPAVPPWALGLAAATAGLRQQQIICPVLPLLCPWDQGEGSRARLHPAAGPESAPSSSELIHNPTSSLCPRPQTPWQGTHTAAQLPCEPHTPWGGRGERGSHRSGCDFAQLSLSELIIHVAQGKPAVRC